MGRISVIRPGGQFITQRQGLPLPVEFYWSRIAGLGLETLELWELDDGLDLPGDRLDLVECVELAGRLDDPGIRLEPDVAGRLEASGLGLLLCKPVDAAGRPGLWPRCMVSLLRLSASVDCRSSGFTTGEAGLPTPEPGPEPIGAIPA
jgi:hypothetical protein